MSTDTADTLREEVRAQLRGGRSGCPDRRAGKLRQWILLRRPELEER